MLVKIVHLKIIQLCTYHLEKNKNVINENATYVTLEIYIDGANEPIFSNTLTITVLKKY